MPRETVHIVGALPRPAERIWPVAGQFLSDWHPLIEWVEKEPAPGRLIRRFGVHGEDKTYREELTYLSDSDFTFRYRALEGIEGIESYTARLKLGKTSAGADLSWEAQIEGPAARLAEVAAGTKAVLQAGVNTIATLDQAPPKHRAARRPPQPIEARILDGPTQIGLDIAPAGLMSAETICLCLHGIGGNRQNWQAQLGALGHDFPIVAMDLRGYGDSTLGAGPTSIDDYCDDINAVVDHFGASRVVLVGLSYGAWIATSYAMRHPDRLAGLVLSGGCTGMSEASPAERENFRVTREVPLNAGKTPADFAPSVVDVIAGPNAGTEIREALHQSMAAIPTETYRDALNCFCNPVEVFDFGRIACPVLLMTGAHDRLAPPDEIRAVSLRIHDQENRAVNAGPVRFEVIAGAGHVCNLEQPLAYNALLKSHLQLVGVPRPKITSPKEEAQKARKRRRILDAALAEFARNGFAGASMQAIADAAGVSKPTLYKYIGQKDDMLSAILDSGQRNLLNPFSGPRDAPMVPALWEFARSYADLALAPDMLALARIVIAEAGRHPDLARQYVNQGPGQAFAGIVAYIAGQQALVRLKADDAASAAEHLWALILSGPRTHALHFPDDPLEDDAVERSARLGLGAFLRAYSTNPDRDLETLAAMVWRER